MIPPLGEAESCAAGSQCDNTGRCVGPPQAVPTTTPVLAAEPPGVTTAAGGVAQTVQVHLAVTQASGVAAAQSTKVRVIALDGVEVSCDASTFSAACQLDSWSFTFDGSQHNASRTMLVRAKPGTAAGHGEVRLRIDALDRDLNIPAGANALTSTDGSYQGIALEAGAPDSFPVSALARGNLIVVRDPTRTIAPDGALLLDVGAALQDRRTAWLRPLGADASAKAATATYKAGIAAYDASKGVLSVPLQIKIGTTTTAWTLHFKRNAPAKSECTRSAQCSGDDVCVVGLQACVPAVVASPPANLTGYQFEDPRSTAWWNAMDDVIGSQGANTGNPAFASTGADVIESLMCTTTAGGGHLGSQLTRDALHISHSGDLACVGNGIGPEQANGAPGAVGLSTFRDRTGSAISSTLVQRCIDDLAKPATSDFASSFSLGVGDCASPARLLPALRMLAVGDLGKDTLYFRNGRLGTLLARLTQQWSELHGFIASTGLSSLEFDEATLSSSSDSRQRLAGLLDVEDAGWAALLDRHITNALSAMSQRSAGDEHATFQPATMDYRIAKQPIAYWPFNQLASPDLDVTRHVRLQPRIGEETRCALNASADYLGPQPARCSGLYASLPASDASLLSAPLASFVFHIGGHFAMDPPNPGVILHTTTFLAYLHDPNHDNNFVLSVVHPFSDGFDRERIDFPEFGQWGNYAFGGEPMTVALVRDDAEVNYTLYVWRKCDGHVRDPGCVAGQTSILHTVTRNYGDEFSGAITAPGTISIGRALCTSDDPFEDPSQCDAPRFNAELDDVGILGYRISPREFTQFAQTRGDAGNHRDLWPADLDLSPYDSQTLFMPTGASVLEAQVAHLDLTAKFVDVLGPVAQAACDSPSVLARADIDAQVVRVGRTLRQNALLVQLTKDDLSDAAQHARILLAGKRVQLARAAEKLASCKNPYGLGRDEVPLYFDSIAPNVDEKKAFFAASDYLLDRADIRVTMATTALATVRASWDQVRQSELQQLATDTSRRIRVEEQQIKYGETMRRLCGISDLTAEQVADQLESGAISPQTCFVKPTTACMAQNASVSVMNMDPTCYRGVIGAALLDIRTAYFAQQAAYHEWQAAIGNSTAASRLCVLKEMDAFGCSALDRHALSGVTCPAGHQGTLELTQAFNNYLTKIEDQRAAWRAFAGFATAFVGAVVAVAATVATAGAAAPALILAAGFASEMVNQKNDTIEERKRNHELVLQARAAQADTLACWTQADQFERAIAAAEDADKQATNRMQSAAVAFDNSLADARTTVLEAPLVLSRERTRPALPIAFHYWLPEALADYQIAMVSARRYAYMALRATEYDALDSYVASQTGKPDRASVIGAMRPDVLRQQLMLMRDQTASRQTRSGSPALKHMAFDLGTKLFGLPEGSNDFGTKLAGSLRPVFSQSGERLGQGLRISLVPQSGAEDPQWRCAERIWRVNLGASHLPSSGDGVSVKLQKRNVFASRRCDTDGLQVSSLRPGSNLLVAAGEPQEYVSEKLSTPADITLQNFDDGATLNSFKFRDDFLNGSSSELSLQGLYGDYVLLFPTGTFDTSFTPEALRDFWLRFDYLSADNTPALTSAAPVRVELSIDPSPITVP